MTPSFAPSLSTSTLRSQQTQSNPAPTISFSKPKSKEKAEEVIENQAGEPELGIVKQGLAFHNLLDREGDPNQDCDHVEAQLPAGEERGPVNQTDVELGLGLDEIGHRLGESREIALVHLLRLLRGLVRSDEADVREDIDVEESEALLRLFELRFSFILGWLGNLCLLLCSLGRNHAESKAALVIHAVHFIGELGFRQVVFEGDSKLQIAALNSVDVSWECWTSVG
nr:hypothetical protein CFP56_55367 [Quercus suber]